MNDKFDKVKLLEAKRILEHFFEDRDYIALIKSTSYPYYCDILHKFAYSNLTSESDILDFLDAASVAYMENAKLNDAFGIRKFFGFDNELAYYCACRLLDLFPDSEALAGETKESLALKISVHIISKTKIKMLDDELYQAIVQRVENIEPGMQRIPREAVLALLEEYNDRTLYKTSNHPVDSYIAFLEKVAGGLKKENFAKRIHTTPQYVTKIMNGKVPSKDVLVKISIGLALGEKMSDEMFCLARETINDSKESTLLLFNMRNSRDKALKQLMNNFELIQKNYPGICKRADGDRVKFANMYLASLKMESLDYEQNERRVRYEKTNYDC